jgi:hypothetical protein
LLARQSASGGGKGSADIHQLDKESDMADEPRKEDDPAPPAEPAHADNTDPRARTEPADEKPQEVVDDDRFQATDN